MQCVISADLKSNCTIIATAAVEGSIGFVVRALKQTPLARLLEGEDPYTFFAPTDDVFSDYTDGKPDELLRQKARLAEILSHHIIPGIFGGSYFNRPERIKTYLGTSVVIDRSHFIKPDIECTNGLIHIIDTVLDPGRDDYR